MVSPSVHLFLAVSLFHDSSVHECWIDVGEGIAGCCPPEAMTKPTMVQDVASIVKMESTTFIKVLGVKEG